MEIFLECTNKECKEKIPVKYKATLKDNKCPACSSPLGLNGDEAQAILLIKAIIRSKWDVTAQQIEELVHDYYVKDLEVKMPRILIEESREERAQRKLASTPEIVETMQPVRQQIPQTIGLTDQQQKVAEANSAAINEQMKKDTIVVSNVENENNGDFTFSGGISPGGTHSSSIPSIVNSPIVAGNLVSRKLQKGPADAGAPEAKPIPLGPPAPFANRHLIFSEDSGND